MDYRNLYDGIDEQVKLPSGAFITPINFDNGATTPPLKSVTKIIADNIQNYGPIARGVGLKVNTVLICLMIVEKNIRFFWIK